MPDFSSNVSGGYAYNQYPYSPFTSNHPPDSPQHFYPTPAPAPTTSDVEVERLKYHFTQREDTFRATIVALLNKVASQQEIIQQNLSCFTGAMKEQMQLREKVEQALQASTKAHREALEARDECRLACSKALADNSKLFSLLCQSDNTRLKHEDNFRDQLKNWSDKIASQERLVHELRTDRKLEREIFCDRLKGLSDRITSLEAKVAQVPVAVREFEDKVNSKVDSQPEANVTPVSEDVGDALGEFDSKVDLEPSATEYVMDVQIPVPPWSFTEQTSMTGGYPDGFVEAVLHVHKCIATGVRGLCRTRVEGAEHLPGPCNVCKTSPLLTHVQGNTISYI